MSQNIKYTTYIVTSYDKHGNQFKKVFGELEIQQMIRFVQNQNKSEIYMDVRKITTTINYHLSKNGFPWLKTQKSQKPYQAHKNIYRLERYCRIGEQNSPNAGFFDFIGYQR